MHRFLMNISTVRNILSLKIETERENKKKISSPRLPHINLPGQIRLLRINVVAVSGAEKRE
jgi:hypothetical protein